jgi:hypothetical protein
MEFAAQNSDAAIANILGPSPRAYVRMHIGAEM